MVELNRLKWLRERLDQVFSPDTAVPGSKTYPPSSGHCAAVALIVQALFGGELVSTRLEGESHWFNRVDGQDIDLTGDQFGYPPVQMDTNLYPDTRVRRDDEVRHETFVRAFRLTVRAGF